MMPARRPMAALAVAVLAAIAAAALAAPAVESWLGHDAMAVDILKRFEPPSAAHPLGTDDIGRDVLVRLLYGGRVSLAAGLVAALLAAAIGTVVGAVAGYLGGWADALLMRVTDSVIALPLLPLLIVLAAVDLRKLGVPEAIAGSESGSLWRIIAITALVGWTTVARLVRGATLSLKQRDFVRAAIAMGASPARVIAVHLVPNAITPIIVATTLAVGNIILFESVLSFLGLGIQPPLPSWGNMLTNAQEVIWTAPWLAIWPGVMIVLTVASCNLAGDALQDWLDPRRRHRSH